MWFVRRMRWQTTMVVERAAAWPVEGGRNMRAALQRRDRVIDVMRC
jgi:hypothetical protein